VLLKNKAGTFLNSSATSTVIISDDVLDKVSADAAFVKEKA